MVVGIYDHVFLDILIRTPNYKPSVVYSYCGGKVSFEMDFNLPTMSPTIISTVTTTIHLDQTIVRRLYRTHFKTDQLIGVFLNVFTEFSGCNEFSDKNIYNEKGYFNLLPLV